MSASLDPEVEDDGAIRLLPMLLLLGLSDCSSLSFSNRPFIFLLAVLRFSWSSSSPQVCSSHADSTSNLPVVASSRQRISQEHDSCDGRPCRLLSAREQRNWTNLPGRELQMARLIRCSSCSRPCQRIASSDSRERRSLTQLWKRSRLKLPVRCRCCPRLARATQSAPSRCGTDCRESSRASKMTRETKGRRERGCRFKGWSEVQRNPNWKLLKIIRITATTLGACTTADQFQQLTAELLRRTAFLPLAEHRKVVALPDTDSSEHPSPPPLDPSGRGLSIPPLRRFSLRPMLDCGRVLSCKSVLQVSAKDR